MKSTHECMVSRYDTRQDSKIGAVKAGTIRYLDLRPCGLFHGMDRALHLHEDSQQILLKLPVDTSYSDLGQICLRIRARNVRETCDSPAPTTHRAAIVSGFAMAVSDRPAFGLKTCVEVIVRRGLLGRRILKVRS
jgi:hypothetical protein